METRQYNIVPTAFTLQCILQYKFLIRSFYVDYPFYLFLSVIWHVSFVLTEQGYVKSIGKPPQSSTLLNINFEVAKFHLLVIHQFIY